MPAEPMSFGRYLELLDQVVLLRVEADEQSKRVGMMKIGNGPRILALEECDERAAFEMPLKGWLSTWVEFDDGRRYRVYFSDLIRLQQDLDEQAESGSACFAEPGLIVVREVTVDAIQDAVHFLWKRGYFDDLKAEPPDGVELSEAPPTPSLQPMR
jgi:hypothetical protein